MKKKSKILFPCFWQWSCSCLCAQFGAYCRHFAESDEKSGKWSLDKKTTIKTPVKMTFKAAILKVATVNSMESYCKSKGKCHCYSQNLKGNMDLQN